MRSHLALDIVKLGILLLNLAAHTHRHAREVAQDAVDHVGQHDDDADVEVGHDADDVNDDDIGEKWTNVNTCQM